MMRIKLFLSVNLLAMLLLSLCAANGIVANNDPRNGSAPYAYDPSAGWIQIWSDEFNGKTLDTSIWTRQVEAPGRYNNEWQAYTANEENAYLDGNGKLVIKATYNGKGLAQGNFESARLHTAGKKSITYGKIAMRAKLPFGKGLWPAFWMLGSNCNEYPGGTVAWPYCGEIDIMEMIGGGINDQTTHGSLHYINNQGKDPGPTYSYTMSSPLSNDFHIYEVEWTPSSFTWKIDGISYGTKLMEADMEEFSKPFFILLNLAVGGIWPGNPDASTVFPQYYIIDWVRVYTPSTIALQASNSQYVCAEGSGGDGVVANRNAIGAWEMFKLIDLGNSNVALQAANGQYVCAEGGGGQHVVANRNAIGAWETFKLIDRGNGNYALQAANGQYVCAEGSGGDGVVANRNAIGAWETFRFLDLQRPAKVALQAANGQYVCAEGSGGDGVVANRNALGAWETFKLIDRGNGRIALQAANGQYVCAEGGGGHQVVANRNAIGAWETFRDIYRGNGNIALQAANGQYVCAEGGGGDGVVANRNAIGAWETFKLIPR
jgi:beta-glucanase (GH16 family)